MNRKIFISLMLFLVLSACTQSLAESTPLPLSASATPTLFLGSPEPAATPVLGVASAPQPLPTFTPLTQPTLSGPSDLYAVVNVFSDDVLNIRSEPGVENPIVGTLEPDESGLTRTGKTFSLGEDTWVEIQSASGRTGWVNADFLTEYVGPAAFCADTRVITLLGDLETAVNTTNGELLRSLVSPAHGVDVIYIRNGTVANYSPDEAGWVFQSNYVVDWGVGAGSGESVAGTFQAIVLPSLQAVFKNETLICNEIQLGGATYNVEWPSEYANLNFYSIYNPGNDPAYDGMDWNTWLAAIEYVDGQPYLFALLHYQWEP